MANGQANSDSASQHDSRRVDVEAAVLGDSSTSASDSRARQVTDGGEQGSQPHGDHESTATAVHESDCADEPADDKDKSHDSVYRHKTGLQDQTSYLPAKQVIVILLALTTVVFLAFLDQTIVSTALPTISAAFDSGSISSWVASSYLLSSTAFQPMSGRLSDIFGRKITLLAFLSVFSVGSLACALARSMIQLIVFRAIQGIGGGALLTLVLIILSDIVSLRDRGKYQGIVEAIIAVANGVGPVLGGTLAQKVTWRWAFYINLPICGLALFVIGFALPLRQVKGDFRQKLKQVDYMGSFLTIAFAALICYALTAGGTSASWSSAQILAPLIVGLAVLAVFVAWEGRFAKIPIMPLTMFKYRTATTACFVTLFSGATILAQIYYIPQYLQITRGDSAIRSGVLILPLLLMVTFTVFVSGQIVSRTGEYKPSICFGYAIWVVGLGLLSTLNERTSTAKLIGYLLLNGFGQGQTLQTTMVAAQAAVPRSDMAAVTSARNFCRSLGGTIALAMSASIINNVFRSDLAGVLDTSTINAIIEDPTAIWRTSAASKTYLGALTPEQKEQVIRGFVKGFNRVFQVLIAFIGVDFIAATLFLKRISLTRDDEQQMKERGRQLMEHRAAKKRQQHGDNDVEKNLDGSHTAAATPTNASARQSHEEPKP